ncbi:hypothetical protein NBRC10512_003489 [Rhodotorula toruloides]|uniref:Uncharacterized protein n=1 Tax=Rhodotorula toruloides (strain NP11) TaxID=1130832 RepID=M7XHK7_RHOT1|nr:uncharacterized protein RHTO_07113 [Rhodotorula toruloides NP11]EMS23379.1 hypothetical protein RHTO_07113 [Rhodotorula toruloides NP11]
MAPLLPLRQRLSALIPRTPATIAHLSVTFLETLVDTVVVALTLNSFEKHVWQLLMERSDRSVLPVYLALFVLAHLTQLVLAVDALVAKNTIQVVALLIFNTLFLVYSAIQVSYTIAMPPRNTRLIVVYAPPQIHEIRPLVNSPALKVLIWFIPAMISLTEAVYIVTIWPIYREYGWQIFKTLGADRRIKKCYAWFQVFICILKFDFFFFVAFSLQLVFLVPTQTSAERGLTIAALPVTLVLLVLGYFSIKREHKVMVYVFLVGCAVGCAYFVYKLFIIYRDRQTDYQLVFKSLTVFAALCLSALLVTTATVIKCWLNFGSGLKYQMSRGEILRSTSNLDLKTSPRPIAEGDEYPLGSRDYYAPTGRNRFRMSMD